MPAPCLFLIDTYGFIFRAYHARARTGAPPMRTTTGLSTEVVYIFSTMLKKLSRTFEPKLKAVESKKSPFEAGAQRLEDPTVQSDAMPAGTDRQPVEVDGRAGQRSHARRGPAVAIGYRSRSLHRTPRSHRRSSSSRCAIVVVSATGSSCASRPAASAAAAASIASPHRRCISREVIAPESAAGP